MGNLDEEVEELFSLRASGQLFIPAQQTLYLYRVQYRLLHVHWTQRSQDLWRLILV